MPKAFVGGNAVDGRQVDMADEEMICCCAMALTSKLRFVGLLGRGSSKLKFKDCYANRNIIPVRITIAEMLVY